MTITRQVQIDLARYTAGVVRARREYELDPFAGTNSENEAAKERMREWRKKRGHR